MALKLRINELLELKGMTAYQLSKATGIGHSALSKIRHNQNKAVNLDYLEAICDALGCEPGDLLVRVDESKPAKKGKSTK